MKPTKKLTPTSRKQTEATAEVIKLGIDIHKTKYVVIRQIDNQAAQSPQSFSPSEFVVWVQRQRLLAKRVVSCYEAGCFGFVLHRKLAEVGVEKLRSAPYSHSRGQTYKIELQRKKGRGRAADYSTALLQTRASAINAHGSSDHGFAGSFVAQDDLGRDQWIIN